MATTTDHILRDEGMRLTNWAHVVPGLIGSLGPMQAAGASLSWLKTRSACANRTRRAPAASARTMSSTRKLPPAPPGSNGLLYLPYLVGERAPRWNPNARGVFLGLKMEHRREDILRSVVEGVGYNLKIILDLLRAGAPVESLTLVGGMARGEIEREIFCDIFGLPVHTLNHLEEATSMGAAVCAGVGVGELKDFSQVDRFIAVKETRYPHAQNRRVTSACRKYLTKRIRRCWTYTRRWQSFNPFAGKWAARGVKPRALFWLHFRLDGWKKRAYTATWVYFIARPSAMRRKRGRSMQAILNGRIVMPNRIVTDSALLFETAIAGLCAPDALPADCQVIDAKGLYVAPD